MNDTAVLLIAHAPLASALRSVAEHVYPDCAARLSALDVQPGMPPLEIEEQARALLAQMPQPEVLVLTDVFGATPCNVAQRLTDRRRIRVVSGVNVPMLWRVLCYAQEGAERLAERAVSGATQGVMPVEGRAPQYQEFRASHGQDLRHDQ
jgi:PTS system ascorbate-specific IIA component